MPEEKDIWNRITANLQARISKSQIETWFSRTVLKNLDSDLAVVEVPNKFVASWLYDNYVDQIKESFRDISGFLPEIRFTYAEKSYTSAKLGTVTTQKQIGPFYTQLNPLSTFASFVTGNSNRFAFSCALEVAKSPAEQYNPLYIFSKRGLGKTHLLNAIGNQVLEGDPNIKIKYISIDDLSSEFSRAARNRAFSDFRGEYRGLDFLILDDIHLVSSRERFQEELISLFNSLLEKKRQIVVAGNAPPSQINGLNPQLRSRLEWGLLLEIQVPDQKTKIQIIKKKAKEKELYIPDDVVFFLVSVTNDTKTLIQYLTGLETHSSIYHRDIDMSTVKSIIKDRPFRKTSVHDIQKLTATHFNISMADLLSMKKKRSFSYPRQLAMYLTRKFSDLSFKEIGKEFGDRDHSTVLHAVKRIEKEKESKREVMDDINKLQNLLT